jgi:hypothetical protein
MDPGLKYYLFLLAVVVNATWSPHVWMSLYPSCIEHRTWFDFQVTRSLWSEEEADLYSREHMTPEQRAALGDTEQFLKRRGRPPGSKDARPRKRRYADFTFLLILKTSDMRICSGFSSSRRLSSSMHCSMVPSHSSMTSPAPRPRLSLTTRHHLLHRPPWRRRSPSCTAPAIASQHPLHLMLHPTTPMMNTNMNPCQTIRTGTCAPPAGNPGARRTRIVGKGR